MAKTSLDKSVPNTRTEFGDGFLPLIMRAWARSLIVANAMFRGWPLNAETAAAEITEGYGYFLELNWGELSMLTGETSRAIAELQTTYKGVMEKIAIEAMAKPTESLKMETFDTILHDLTKKVFALMSQLDKEMFGLSDHQTDGGTKL